MNDFARIIILVGIVMIMVGFAIILGPKLPWVGKLPGDILIKRDGFTLFFPLATSIIISIIVTIIINLFIRK